MRSASGRVAVVIGSAVLVGSSVAGCSDHAPKRVASSARSAGHAASHRASASAAAHATRKADGRPLIQRVAWVSTSGGGSLHVFPTQAGRTDSSTTGAAAWIQVQRIARRAGGQAARVVDRPGMRAQFVCHWQFARVKEPKKPSWNLEPWRPVVSEKTLIDARCNPGGAEGPDQ